MNTFSKYIKWGVFFGTAILFAVSVQWVRQQPPKPSDYGWAYQVVESLDQAGDLHHALEALPRALNDPQSREQALNFQAAIALRKQKAPSALYELEQEIMGTERKYKIPRLTFSKGVIADLHQDDELALYWYQKAIELKPTMSIAYVQQGLVFERMGRLDEAHASFQKALDLNETAPLSRFHYGLFLARSTDQRDQALEQATFLEDARPIYAKIIREALQPPQNLSVSSVF